MTKLLALLNLAVLLSSAACTRPVATPAATAAAAPTMLDLQDSARQRAVPVALYRAAGPRASGRRPRLALLSHGYGGQHTDYGFVARALLARGYWVASVQHELPGDEPIATTGNLRETRRPNWERGVQNLLFVRRELLQRYPVLTAADLLLVGHSNGGDMAMLFATEYPKLVDKVISLDNRRMPLPRTRRPRLLTIRSSDQAADPGVLPTAAEQRALRIRVVPLPATVHNDMWDGATAAQQLEITRIIDNFLAH